MTLVTGAALVDPLKKMAQEVLKNVRVISILDDSLIADVIEAGKMTPAVLERIHQYCHIGAGMEVDVILETCSSVGESVDYLQPFFDIPVLRIDRPMVEQAVDTAQTIGVLATLPTTLNPTMELIKQVAEEKGKKVEIVNGLADGAFKALTEGDPARHDQLLSETAKQVSDSCDVIVLAQGSMARMEAALRESTGIPVLSSLKSGLEAIRRYMK
ncbi:aspartate/glutamate racemase family protein [Marispirochaeta sp.]|jgi:Asp/Glu/hydantoin racemase|uniref:aspartate/glutamate racemase family protein n=1 Tax=Marispirochaeta sp. TaxID=2038653 RepID=UPI0029C7644E|nr:aspartate/glutamate racemase family protein [Marispirochaeta sp.]